MIQAKNIHKFYDQLEVLKGVDIHIKKGEIVSIVGASGAGKTTLLQILGTLDQPNALTHKEGIVAELKINNEDIIKLQNQDNKNPKQEKIYQAFIGIFIVKTIVLIALLIIYRNEIQNSLEKIIPSIIGFSILLFIFIRISIKKNKKDKLLSSFRNLNLGFIFQFHQLLPEFTALENVCIPAFIANNRSKIEVEKEAIKLLEYLGLSHRINHKPNSLSGGEQQRVAVARALINKPDVIFADEPSGNLDTASAENLHQLFFDLRNEFGQTFVIVTHNEELANMADRKLVMVDGRISV